MEFSAYNPQTSNSLNVAARRNDVPTVKKMLKTRNPNCVDNRGWTCLHEAAASDSYESLVEILAHRDCRKLAETHEGHTALYLACQNQSSLRTIQLILESQRDIANYASTEKVTPLHVASALDRPEVVQLLLDHGAYVNVQDFDGDTPLHDAANTMRHEIVCVLLHAGADPLMLNDSSYSAFHLACYRGCTETVKLMSLFVADINHLNGNNDSPLMLATYNGTAELITFMLENNANPLLRNSSDQSTLEVALINGNANVFKVLLAALDVDDIDRNIVTYACKPHFFNMEILITLLESDLGPEFFNIVEPFYVTLEEIGDQVPKYDFTSPLNSFLHISEYIYTKSSDLFLQLINLYLMRGVSVNAVNNECPPLVYLHYCEKSECFNQVFEILVEHGCDIDYCSMGAIPDAIVASLATGASTLPVLLQHSMKCEPDSLLEYLTKWNLLGRVPIEVQDHMMSLVGIEENPTTPDKVACYVAPLKHLSRKVVRRRMRDVRWRNSGDSITRLERLPLPPLMRNFLRYI